MVVVPDAQLAPLATGFPPRKSERTRRELESGLPNLHLGVVSSDVLARGGRLESQPRQEGCVPPDGAFIENISLDYGQSAPAETRRARNVPAGPLSGTQDVRASAPQTASFDLKCIVAENIRRQAPFRCDVTQAAERPIRDSIGQLT